MDWINGFPGLLDFGLGFFGFLDVGFSGLLDFNWFLDLDYWFFWIWTFGFLDLDWFFVDVGFGK